MLYSEQERRSCRETHEALRLALGRNPTVREFATARGLDYKRAYARMTAMGLAFARDSTRHGKAALPHPEPDMHEIRLAAAAIRSERLRAKRLPATKEALEKLKEATKDVTDKYRHLL